MKSNKNKLAQFEAIHSFANVFEHTDWLTEEVMVQQGTTVLLKSHWQQYFGNEAPITLEVACGKGEYTLALAERHPDRNFVGIDLKGNRLWHGAKKALDKGLNNVAFLRCQLLNITKFFQPKSVTSIWITFADPYPNVSDEKRRLVSPRFLTLYKSIATAQATLHLKHDDDAYVQYAREQLQLKNAEELEYYADVHNGTCVDTLLTDVTTYYEKMHLDDGRSIKYVKWRL